MRNVTKAPCLTGESKQKEDKKSEEESSPLTPMLVLLDLVTCGLHEVRDWAASQGCTDTRKASRAHLLPTIWSTAVGGRVLPPGRREKARGEAAGRPLLSSAPRSPTRDSIDPPTSLATLGGVTRGCEGGWGTWRLEGAGSGGKEEGESGCIQALTVPPVHPVVPQNAFQHTQNSGSPRDMPGRLPAWALLGLSRSSPPIGPKHDCHRLPGSAPESVSEGPSGPWRWQAQGAGTRRPKVPSQTSQGTNQG